MTLQTRAPIERLNLNVTSRSARELARALTDGLMTVDLPYQRGSVWSLGQRIGLVKSWLAGTPIPAIIVNDRSSATWKGPEVRAAGPVYAVIDGRQRLETAVAWFAGRFTVPASWFPTADIKDGCRRGTHDGDYVAFSGLIRDAQRHFAIGTAQLPMAEAKVATVEAEAEIFLRVNGGGVPQAAAHMSAVKAITSRGAPQ